MTASTGANKSQKNYWLVVAALSGVPLIMVLGNSMLIPVLPDIRNTLNLSSVQVSLIITLFSLPAGLIIPVTGFLSDRYGRKAVIIPSLIVYGAGGLIAALAAIFFKQNAYTLILAGRVIQGIGAAGTAPIAMALCGDLFKDKERSRSLGSIEASNGLGKVISPVLGAAIGLLAWYAAFVLFPLIVIPVVVGMWLLVKEPEGRNKQKLQQYLRSFTQVFKEQKGLLLSSYLAGAIVLLVLFGVLFYLSEYLEQQYGLDGIPKGLVLAIPVLFMSATSFITGFVIKKKESLMRILVITGLGIMTASLIFLPLAKGVFFYFAAISVIGIGTGLVLPCLNMLITSAATIKERGLITSLYGSVRFFGVAAGPPLYGYLMAKGTGLMFWISAGLALAGAVVFFMFGRVEGSSFEKNPASFIFKPVPAGKPSR
ncbi:MAG: MFS transporter [Desulfotomaculaceae bacterium]|nr:MFS transporter [Desulfotomaculaceae bacterium]